MSPARKRAEVVEVPLMLATPEFLELWSEWVAEQTEARRGKYSARAQRMVLDRLSGMSPAEACDAIRHSIESGYKTIWSPPKPTKAAMEAQRIAAEQRRADDIRRRTLEDYVRQGVGAACAEDRESVCLRVRDNYGIEAAREVGREIARRVKVLEQKGAKGAKEVEQEKTK